MNKEFVIIDPRPFITFKDKTFSDFKKRDVITKLFKCVEEGKIEEGCYWITECICSGYSIELVDKLILHSSKINHVNNPKLPEYLWRRHMTFVSSYDHISKKDKEQLIHLRNTQSVRNLLFDLSVTVSLSPRSKRYDKYPKVTDNDFQYSTIQSKLLATMQILPSYLLRFTDPEELRIIMNEFLFHLKNALGGYEKACYWVAWLICWEKINKKKKIKFEIESRDINEVDPKYCKDCIWLLWEIIFYECQERSDDIKLQIQSLYRFFRHNYTSGKRCSRIPLLYHAIGYLTLPVNFKVPIRKDNNILIQTQCNVNVMFRAKKNNEVTNYIPAEEKIKKIIGSEREIALSKFNAFMDIDELSR
tara:strand:+ start:256 stop:1338 length:1083 start_codon:yes stop_codon:yes gene_type:complete